MSSEAALDMEVKDFAQGVPGCHSNPSLPRPPGHPPVPRKEELVRKMEKTVLLKAQYDFGHPAMDVSQGPPTREGGVLASPAQDTLAMTSVHSDM